MCWFPFATPFLPLWLQSNQVKLANFCRDEMHFWFYWLQMPKSLSLEDKAHEIKSPFHCEKEVQKSTVVQITKKDIFLCQSALDQFTKCFILLALAEKRAFLKNQFLD